MTMARLPQKSSLAPASRSGGSVPQFPELPTAIKNLPGADVLQAKLDEWNRLMGRRWTVQDTDHKKGISIVENSIELQNGYIEASFTLTVAAGNVVTGMRLFSAEGDGLALSVISFQADVFQIATATGGHKQIFTATAGEVKFGDVLTVNLADAELYIGAGDFEDAATPFYVDGLGRFSLKDVLSFDGTTFIISGTGAAGNYVAITDNGLQVGDDPTEGTIHINNNGGNPYFNLRYNGDVMGSWSVQATHSGLQLVDDSGNSVTLDGRGNPGVSIFGPPGVNGLTVSNDVLILGDLQFGAYSAITTETLAGFVTAKDASGTVRKFAVVA